MMSWSDFLLTLQPESALPVLLSHRFLLSVLVVSLPLIYYAIRLILHVRRTRRRWKILTDNFGGLPKHWLYGNLHQHPGPGQEGLVFHEKLMRKYPLAFVLWMSPLAPILQVVHPETAKAILKTTEPKPRGPDGVYRIMLPWLGDGLLLSSGDKWHRNRRLLTPAFHFDVLKPYMDIYNSSVETFLAKIEASNKKDDYMEVFNHVGLLTLDVILQCAFSFKDDVQGKGDSHPYVNAVKRLGSIIVYRAFHPHLMIDAIFKWTALSREHNRHVEYAHQVAENVIAQRKAKLRDDPDEGKKRYRDFLDILLLAKDEDGTGLTDAEIRSEVDTFLFEGHDTTASAISWILYTFAGHSAEQEKARQEVDAVLRGRDSSKITWDDLNQFPYLSLCIKEAMRVHSPVPFIGRQATKDLTLGGKTVPAGTVMDIVIYDIHHNPDVWGEDHNEFRPERFEHDNIKDMDSHAFVPFSAGPRNCIGQNFAMHEIKIAVARVLHEYVMETDPSRPAVHKVDVVMRTENGMYIKFMKRDQK